MRSFVGWTLVAFVTVLQLVTVNAVELLDKKSTSENAIGGSDQVSFRGHRSPRYKSGPAPGSWYYIMGHGGAAKRRSGLRVGGPILQDLKFNNEQDNTIPQLWNGPSPGDRRLLPVSPMTSFHVARAPPLPSDVIASLDAGHVVPPVALLPASRLDRLDEMAESSSGQTGAGGRKLLDEFLQFLVLKEQKKLNGCLTSAEAPTAN